MFICCDLVFTVEKNLTSSVSPQLSARCLGLFFMWSGSFHRWIYTLTFPLLPCAPCLDMRTEQLGMKGLWQPRFDMRSNFSPVTAELALTFSPLAPFHASLTGLCFLEQAVLPSQRWGCIPRLVLCMEHCLWQHCCVGIFFFCPSPLDAIPSESLCWKHCWFVQFMNVIMCAESSLAFFIS